MKKVLIAGLIALSAVGSAHAWGRHEQGIVTGVVGLWAWQQLNRPQIIVQPQIGYPQPQIVYPQPQIGYPQVYEYRTPPVYSPQYQPPNVCIHAYDQFRRYLGCIPG
jgi:hypothetical protein